MSKDNQMARFWQKMFFLMLTFSFHTKLVAQTISDIKIIKTDFSTETIIGINCDNFPRNFSHNLDTFYIQDKVTQNKILDQLRHSTIVSPKWDIDTRAKMYIHYNTGKTDSLCFGYTVIFSFNGTPKKLDSRNLVEMLDTMTNKNRKEE